MPNECPPLIQQALTAQDATGQNGAVLSASEGDNWILSEVLRRKTEKQSKNQPYSLTDIFEQVTKEHRASQQLLRGSATVNSNVPTQLAVPSVPIVAEVIHKLSALSNQLEQVIKTISSSTKTAPQLDLTPDDHVADTDDLDNDDWLYNCPWVDTRNSSVVCPIPLTPTAIPTNNTSDLHSVFSSNQAVPETSTCSTSNQASLSLATHSATSSNTTKTIPGVVPPLNVPDQQKNPEDCVLCQERMVLFNPLNQAFNRTTEEIVFMPCIHPFHKKCLANWINCVLSDTEAVDMNSVKFSCPI